MRTEIADDGLKDGRLGGKEEQFKSQKVSVGEMETEMGRRASC